MIEIINKILCETMDFNSNKTLRKSSDNNLLNRFNLINPTEIKEFISKNHNCISFINKSIPLLDEYYPNHKFYLKYWIDPESSVFNKLIIYIKIKDDFEKEWSLLNKLESNLDAYYNNDLIDIDLL
ncbi:MAG: hypothetical protein Q4P14_03145 [Methanobacteriaceae archaeon]|nr:hypothetical protein [Methanobacteriaceae archaeon]